MLLEVWEGRTFHYTQPTIDLIKSYQISYSYERELTKDVATSNSKETLNERLKAGCRKIQENYEEQIQKLKFEMENLL